MGRAVAVLETLRFFLCAKCRRQVLICSACDRGNLYCSDSCRASRRKESRRAATRRYQSTFRGAQKHAARQHRYRLQVQKVTHRGSARESTASYSIPLSNRARDCCHFCGKSGNGFVRFGRLRTVRRRCVTNDTERIRGRNPSALLR